MSDEQFPKDAIFIKWGGLCVAIFGRLPVAVFITIFGFIALGEHSIRAWLWLITRSR
jgi:hypothetical protein